MASSTNGICNRLGDDCHWVYGKLSFCRVCCTIGESVGSFFYKGKFEGTYDVAIKELSKDTKEHGNWNYIVTTLESEVLRRVDEHKNLLRYYITEQDSFYWFVNSQH